jgi:hypothetical protein
MGDIKAEPPKVQGECESGFVEERPPYPPVIRAGLGNEAAMLEAAFAISARIKTERCSNRGHLQRSMVRRERFVEQPLFSLTAYSEHGRIRHGTL